MAAAALGRALKEGSHFGFDWAEDVENELERRESLSWDLCHDFEGPSSTHRVYPGDREKGEINDGEVVEYMTEGDLSDDDEDTTNIPFTEEVSTGDDLHHRIKEEFRRRDDAILDDEAVHHFNWLGCPIYQPSATSAAQSLAIICSGPKIANPRDKLRIGSILRQAYQYLDPVVQRAMSSNSTLTTGDGA